MNKPLLSRRNLIKSVSSALIVGLAFFSSAPVQAEGVTVAKIKEMGKLRVGVEATYPPFTFREGGKLVGYDMDLLEYFTKELGVEAEVIDTQWSGIIPALYADRFEIIMTSMSYNKGRLEKVLFSIPYAEASQALLIRADDKDKIKTIEDMTGKVMGVKLGSPGEVMLPAMEKSIAAAKGSGFSGHKTYDDHPSAYLALSQGSVDGVLNTLPTLAKVVKDRPGYYTIVRGVAHQNWAGIAMRKEDTEVKAVIDKVLTQMKADGSLYKLQEKWFGLKMDLADDVPTF
tara:strand:+ start:780 stop:1637 length:858 start_codon:yes stop_codon:yes gene_type:complete